MKILLNNYKKSMLSVFLFSSVSAFFRVLPSYLLAFATNAIFNKKITLFFLWDIIILFFWLVFVIFNYWLSVYQEVQMQKISQSLRNKEAVYISKIGTKEFNTTTADGFVSKMVNDISQIETNGILSLYSIMMNFWLILFSTIALALFNYWLVVLILFLTILILFIPQKLGERLMVLGNELSNSNAYFIKNIANILKGYKVFRYSNHLNHIPQKINEYSDELTDKKIKISKKRNKIANLIAFTSLGSQMLVDIFTGYLVIVGKSTIGSISSSGSLAGNIFNSVSILGQSFMQIKSVDNILENFFHKEDNPDLFLHKHKNVVNFNELTIKDLSFGYEKNKFVLENFNLTIERGKKYLLIGNSGSGKSTLLKILIGDITEYEGNIKINNEDINNININSFMQYIDQETYLFNATYIENVTLWNSYEESTIQTALKKASIDFFENENQMVENNGSNLSGGQKQRMALARSFIQNKSFIILDEGTASLDKNNSLIIENLLLENKDLTIILVTHNPNAENIEKFDKIISLN